MPIKKDAPMVLCIEDEASVAAVIRASLTYGGFKVTTAENAAEGLQKAQARRPDLILLDLILPDINGFSFFDLLQESELADVPVMIVSGCITGEAQALGRRLGACDYVTKPFEIKDLIARVKKAVQSHKLQKTVMQRMDQESTEKPAPAPATKAPTKSRAKATPGRHKPSAGDSIPSSKRR